MKTRTRKTFGKVHGSRVGKMTKASVRRAYVIAIALGWEIDNSPERIALRRWAGIKDAQSGS